MTKDELENLQDSLKYLHDWNERCSALVLDTDFQDYHALPERLFDILYHMENRAQWIYKALSQLNEVLQRGVEE